MPAQTVIKLRRGTAAQWTSTNPVLAAGEIGLETDTLRTKYGNGTLTWTALPYSVADASGTSSVDWTSVLNKPATFPSSPHTHVMADITDLEFPPTTILSDTAPVNPVQATRWIHTLTFIEYIYYNGTWVEV